MPIYEYECGGCGHKLEVLQRISDAPLEHCPACEQDALRKLVSAAGFQPKGTGWYHRLSRQGKPPRKPRTAARSHQDGDRRPRQRQRQQHGDLDRRRVKHAGGPVGAIASGQADPYHAALPPPHMAPVRP